MAAESEKEQTGDMRNLASKLHNVYSGALLVLKKEKSFFGVYEE